MSDSNESRNAAPTARAETLRATFAVNRDRLAIQYYAIGNPDQPGAAGIRLSIQDPNNQPRKIEATNEAAQLANSVGRSLSEMMGTTSKVQAAPLNPAILALIK